MNEEKVVTAGQLNTGGLPPDSYFFTTAGPVSPPDAASPGLDYLSLIIGLAAVSWVFFIGFICGRYL